MDQNTASNILESGDGREKLIRSIVRHVQHQEVHDDENYRTKLHSKSEQVVVGSLLSVDLRVFVEPITLTAGLTGRSVKFDCLTNLYYKDRLMIFEFHALKWLKQISPPSKIAQYFAKVAMVKKRHPEIYLQFMSDVHPDWIKQDYGFDYPNFCDGYVFAPHAIRRGTEFAQMIRDFKGMKEVRVETDRLAWRRSIREIAEREVMLLKRDYNLRNVKTLRL
jgi:hypothetical protein